MSDEDTPHQATKALTLVHAVWRPDVTPDFEDFGASYVPDHLDMPSPLEKVLKKAMLDISNDDTTTEGTAVLMFNLGWPSTAVIEVLEEGFQMINDMFSALAGQVGIPFQQVISHFTKQFSHLNSTNYWNLYQRYSMANKAQELARLEESELVNGTLCKCFHYDLCKLHLTG